MSGPLLLLHVPKTGGTSVVASLRAGLGEAGLTAIPERWPDGGFLSMAEKWLWAERHRAALVEARVVWGHFPYGLHEAIGIPPAYVTLFRDPLERMVSQFRHLRTIRAQSMPYHRDISSMDFAAFDRHSWPRDATGYHCEPNVYTFLLSGGLEGPAAEGSAAQHLRSGFRLVGLLAAIEGFMAALSSELGTALGTEWRRRNDEVSAIKVDAPTRQAFERRNRADYRLYALAQELAYA